ncbi:aminotransferase class IV-domain-containing protein [Dipodascopsis tothii]|uniref:aminotransferase class IV-domain-containing protein n=1 Tax=Dipodascopsis tothii TaxID=44089 RepID=UPI0034CF0E42
MHKLTARKNCGARAGADTASAQNKALFSSSNGLRILAGLRRPLRAVADAGRHGLRRGPARALSGRVLPLHAAPQQHFGWIGPGLVEPKQLLAALYGELGDCDGTVPHRLRVLLGQDGRLAIEHTVPAPVRVSLDMFSGTRANNGGEPEWLVYLDRGQTPQGDFTRFKTTNRDVYTAARERTLAGKDPNGGRAEVIVFNDADEATEGTLTNVAFWRGGQWVTPAVDDVGGLIGIVRTELLARGDIVEAAAPITRASIAAGDRVLMFNGVQGAVAGRVVA